MKTKTVGKEADDLMIINYWLSLVDYVVPTIIDKGLEHSYFAYDKLLVASWHAYLALKRANRAKIKWHNEQLLLAAKIDNVEDMRQLVGAYLNVESKDSE